MSDDAAPEKFLIQLPVWTIADVAICQAKGLEPAIAIFSAPEIGKILPLFTDEDLAKRFLETVPVPGKSRVWLRTMKAVRAVIAGWYKAGVGHVGIDMSFASGGSISGRFYPCQELLDTIPTDAT
jgi:hypothetical protein